MLEELKEQVWRANMSLKEQGLVILTWGNVSGIDESRAYVAIKPSGVGYAELSPENIVIVDMQGQVVEGDLKPSSDTATHLELYRAFPEIGGVCHTHSLYATSFAQAADWGVDGIGAFGTTHADYFDGAVPCTRAMKKKEILQDYEKNTGLVIIETLRKLKLKPERMPGILVKSHGPFTWGKNAEMATENSLVLETVAHIAFNMRAMGNLDTAMPDALLRKHFDRKHGDGAYYGQDK